MRIREKEHNLVCWARVDFARAEEALAQLLVDAWPTSCGAEHLGKKLWTSEVQDARTRYLYLKELFGGVDLPLRE